ncbi:MAG: glycoside hydrolase family 97 N-terminal domain-containing protein, partial [Parabacteroides sp.]
MKRTGILAVALCGLCAWPLMAQKRFQLQSPDQKIQVEVTMDEQIHFALSAGGEEVMNSTLSLTLTDGKVLGENPKVTKSKRQSVNQTIPSPFYKKSEVKDHYNELCLDFKGNYGLVLRAYDEGVAYRFTTKMKDSICIANEEATFRFAKDYKTFSNFVNSTAPTFEEQFFNSFETTYVNEPITKIDDKRLKILPLLVDLEGGKKMVITEADLEDYPGMYLNNATDQPLLQAIHAPRPKRVEQGGHNRLQMLVKERENYIAKVAGTRAFPWRVFALSSGNDAELANGD